MDYTQYDNFSEKIYDLCRTKMFQQALRICDDALKEGLLQKDFIYGKRGYINAGSGALDSAIKDYKLALIEMPDNPAHIHCLAECYFNVGSYEDTIKLAKKLLEVENSRDSIAFVFEAFYFLAGSYIRLGDKENAKHYLDKIPEHQGGFLDGHYIENKFLLLDMLKEM